MDYEHVPVMPKETLAWLDPGPGKRFLDGTLGFAGHARAVLEQGGDCTLLGLDRDELALDEARKRLEPYGGRAILANERFSRFPSVLEEVGWDKVDGALVDLGVSSMQLDDPERGFSFLSDGPLDMRMGAGGGEAPAERLVNKASLETLKKIIGGLGEEPMGGRIARAIIEARKAGPIRTTLELARLVESAYPAARRAKSRRHPATKTFQALRMAVNKELEELERFLELIPGYLNPGARVVVISFHSLEDRMVKRAFQREAKGCVCPREAPICTCGKVPRLKVLTRKPVGPGPEEAETNPRARSAKLRAAERLAEQD